MTHVTCRLTAKNRDQLRNGTLGNRVWATFIFTFIGSNILEAFTSISRRRWTRATRYLKRIVLYTELDVQSDNLSKVVGQTSTVASNVN